MTDVYVGRTTQQRHLRAYVVQQIGAEKASMMNDIDITNWLEDQGFQSYIEYCGSYDDSDDVLIAKPNDIEKLVSEGKAFWATRGSVS